MSKTSLSDSYSNLCRDYSSFTKWAISKISKNTDKWTDYTVSEPDTLMLSSISTMHDYVQYTIDQMYLNTDIDVCSTRFLHQVSAAMGQYLAGTNEIKIPVKIVNNSPEIVTIDAYEVITYGNELFTNPNKLIIQSNSMIESYIVRNTRNEMIYKIDKNSNGEFFLNGSIEKGSISIIGIGKDTQEKDLKEPLAESNNIFDVLYDESKPTINTPAEYKYLITSIDANTIRIKISPRAQGRYSAIIVNYTVIDDYPIKENLQLNLLSDLDRNITITTTSNVSKNSEIPINDEKLVYLNSLNEIKTLCNKPYKLELDGLSKRIDNYRLTYEPNGNRMTLPFLEYSTFDYIPLTGDQTDDGDAPTMYFKDFSFIPLTLDSEGNPPEPYLLTIQFNRIPVYDLVITYYNSDETIRIYISNSDLKKTLSENQMSITITLQKYPFKGATSSNSLPIYVGFKDLNEKMVQLRKLLNQPIFIVGGNKGEITEKSILLEKLTPDLLIDSDTTTKFLIPYILDLSSTITLSQDVDQLDIITKITTLLYDTLVNGEIVNNIRGSYRRLELLIKQNIKEIVNIQFNIGQDENATYLINQDQYLVIDTPENYKNSGTIKFEV